jgi:molybdopterin-guanine dinucleotide biosynthesis protein A
MGVDKALLRLGNETLLGRAIATSKQECDSVVLVGDRARLGPYGPVIEDEFPGQGPLAGIHAALRSEYSQELNLILSVDIPAISAAYLKYILNVAASNDAHITVQRAADHLQTLCAVYRRGFAAVAERALREGRNKIEPLFAETSTRILEEAEMKAVGFSPDIFDNVNTPEDWKRMRKRLGEASE